MQFGMPTGLKLQNGHVSGNAAKRHDPSYLYLSALAILACLTVWLSHNTYLISYYLPRSAVQKSV